MTTPLLRRKRVLAAKVETTPGTAETLSAADGAFNAYNVIAQADIAVEEREGQGAFNYLTGVPGQRGGTLSFRVDLGWDGTTTMPSWADVLLPGVGLVETSQVYSPISEAPGSNVKTLTLAVYLDGVKKTLAGAAGNVVFTFPTGRMAYADFTFTGVWQPPTDTAMIAPTYPTAAPVRFASGTATWQSVAQKVEQIQIDLGNSVVLRHDPSTAAGYVAALVTNRNPRITCNPESRLVADDDRFGDWIAGTAGAFAVQCNGAGTSTIAFDAAKAQLLNVQEAARDDYVVDDLTFLVTKASNEDEELQITFTETP